MHKLTFLKFFEPFEWVFLCSGIKKREYGIGGESND